MNIALNLSDLFQSEPQDSNGETHAAPFLSPHGLDLFILH